VIGHGSDRGDGDVDGHDDGHDGDVDGDADGDDESFSRNLDLCSHFGHRASSQACPSGVVHPRAAMEEFLAMNWDDGVLEIPLEAGSPDEPPASPKSPTKSPLRIPQSDDPGYGHISPVSPASETEVVELAGPILQTTAKAKPTPPAASSSSSAPPPAPEPSPTGNLRCTERWRPGVNGGKARYGSSGGAHRAYYAGLYRAKGQGKEAMRQYIRLHGPPPASKGKGKGKGKDKDKGDDML